MSMNLKFEVASRHEIIVDGYEREGGWREKLFNECKYTSMQFSFALTTLRDDFYDRLS